MVYEDDVAPGLWSSPRRSSRFLSIFFSGMFVLLFWLLASYYTTIINFIPRGYSLVRHLRLNALLVLEIVTHGDLHNQDDNLELQSTQDNDGLHPQNKGYTVYCIWANIQDTLKAPDMTMT